MNFYGIVNDLVEYNGELIAGGNFTQAGDTLASCIARWDGTKWSPLGSGVDREVWALEVYGGNLIVGGDFTQAGGTSAEHIARWSGTAWTSLDSGLNDRVEDLKSYGGNLIAGGWFSQAGTTSVNKVASWNGTAWAAVGSGVSDANYPYKESTGPQVIALEVFKNELIAGGDFFMAGGNVVNNIAGWDGVSWEPVGGPFGRGLNGWVRAFSVYDSVLIVGGEFILAGDILTNGVAGWDGKNWTPLGSGVDGLCGACFSFTGTQALTVYDGSLIAGGAFALAGDTLANCIARWDGTGWYPLDLGTNGEVTALTQYRGDLIAAGWFTQAGGSAAYSIARWDGSSWNPLGLGTNGNIKALAVFNNELIAGGQFTEAGGVPINNIARWNGTSWSSLGSGLDCGVLSLSVFENNLIAGVDYLCSSHVKSWDSATWTDMGSFSDQVFTLTTYKGSLLAGGWFRFVSGNIVNYIARWDGSAWRAIGSGLGGDPSLNSANALAVYDGRLYVGGLFTHAGNKASYNIASWAGSLSAGAKDHYPPAPQIALEHNVPNPFNPVTRIDYSLSTNGPVDIAIYDSSGRRLITLLSTIQGPGRFSVKWDGRDENGRQVPSGVYFYRLATGGRVISKKMVLLK